MRRLALLASLCSALSGLMLAQTSPAFKETVADNVKSVPACARYLQSPLPEADAPTPAEAAALKGCTVEGPYYGSWAPRDPVAARHCAYAQRDSGNDTVFGGSALLMMLYANGLDVPRNYAAALHFACEVEGAPAETEGRVAHLEKLKAQHAEASRFDLCDDITSGLMEGFCASRDAGRKKTKRDAVIDTLRAHWTEPQQQTFHRLELARDAFFDARTDNEVDLSGSGRAAFAIAEDEELRKGFLAALKRFAAGQLPKADAAGFAEADAQLNRIYAQALRSAGKPSSPGAFGPFGTINADGIRATQRLWLPYRDAWVAFATQTFPQASADGMRTWITRQRSAQLEEFASSSK